MEELKVETLRPPPIMSSKAKKLHRLCPMTSNFSLEQHEWLARQSFGGGRYNQEHLTTMYIVNFKYTIGSENLLEGTDFSVREMEAKYNTIFKVSLKQKNIWARSF